MRVIVITKHGGPEVLSIEERPDPVPKPGEVLIEVKAFGLNHAEMYFRKGAWGEVAEITGIECVGVVRGDPEGKLKPGQKVMAMVGGLGRSRSGSYAELTCVPATNVVAVTTELSWEELAAIPESYATAWSAVVGILGVKAGEVILIRGATSALGQAAVNIAVQAGVRVFATTRQTARVSLLQALGAERVLMEGAELARAVHHDFSKGVDAVLDIVGNSTILDSLMALRRGGRACQVGFLGGGGPLTLEPVFQIPSGRFFSVFASALALGTAEFPLEEIPFQEIVDRVERGIYQAKPAKVFRFEEIQEAHRLMESGGAGGKLVVVV